MEGGAAVTERKTSARMTEQPEHDAICVITTR
jgi:hypothetical protein